MRTIAFAVLALAGCHDHDVMGRHEYEPERSGTTTEDFEAPAADKALRAAIIRDVRDVWMWQEQVDRGTPTCPGMRLDGAMPVCTMCKAEATMKVFTIRADQPDQAYPQRQSAYLCPEEMIYWLHVEGGIERWNAWLGPRRLKLASASSDDHDH